MPDYKILLENENAVQIEDVVRQGLRDADPADVPPRGRNYQPLYLALRDSDGAMMGGLYGMIIRHVRFSGAGVLRAARLHRVCGA